MFYTCAFKCVCLPIRTHATQLRASVCGQPLWNDLCSAQRDATAGGREAPRQNTGVWMPSVSRQWWQQPEWDPHGEGEQKGLKWIYSSSVGGWMCRRWSDDHLCSLLKWNMMARELSAISCLAQEAPIWSWVLSVLCCCVAWCCNSTCHCRCCSLSCYYFWSTTRVSRGRWGGVEREKWYSQFKKPCCGSARRRLVKTYNEWGVYHLNRKEGVIEAMGGESVGGRAGSCPYDCHIPPPARKAEGSHSSSPWQPTRDERREETYPSKNDAGMSALLRLPARTHTHTHTHTQTQCLHISFGSSRKTVSERKSLTESRAFSTQQHNHVSSSQQSDCNPPTGLMFRAHRRREAAIRLWKKEKEHPWARDCLVVLLTKAQINLKEINQILQKAARCYTKICYVTSNQTDTNLIWTISHHPHLKPNHKRLLFKWQFPIFSPRWETCLMFFVFFSLSLSSLYS